MSMEDELNNWLRRKECTFAENLQFALKAWQSAELTILSKYEVILQWFSEAAAQQTTQTEFPWTEVEKLLQLPGLPGSVGLRIKINFIQTLLQVIENLKDENVFTTRRIPELLQLLLNFELVQDVFRSDYTTYAQTYALLFSTYEKYLSLQTQILPAFETSFFKSILKALKDNIKRVADLRAFDACYAPKCLPALTQVLIVLQKTGLDFSLDFNELEQQLCEALKENALLERIWALPLHARLRLLDSAIFNRLGEVPFLTMLLKKAFYKHKVKDVNDEHMLTTAAYILELLRRHDAKLQFKVNTQTALEYLGTNIHLNVMQLKQDYLAEVLQLLCAVLRYNPLILENNIFQLTLSMMLADKPVDSVEMALYNEFLLLLIDMYRRLSRTEKFVSNLLKTVKLQKPTEQQEKSEQLPSEQPKNTYVQLLFKSVEVRSTCKVTLNEFPQLNNSWPYHTVGQAFSNLIASLVSKASSVVWKTLLYALKELLETAAPKLTEHALFQLDLHAALLSQYYDGVRLVEHYTQFNEQINELREFSHTILANFGKFALKHAAEVRVLNAFLSCCYHARNAELLLVYYKPDSIAENLLEDTPKQLKFNLPPQEWTSLEKQALASQNQHCLYLWQRLQCQQQVSELICNQQPVTNFFTQFDITTLKILLSDKTASWLVPHMSSKEKLQIIESLWQHECFELLSVFQADLQSLNFIALLAYEMLMQSFLAKCKKSNSLLTKMECDFAALRSQLSTTADLTAETTTTLAQQIVKAYEAQTEAVGLKKIPKQAVKIFLNVQRNLKFKFVRSNMKIVLYGLQMLLYADLKAAEADELALEVCKELTAFLQHDANLQLFLHYPLDMFLQLLPADDCWSIYELLFANIRQENDNSLKFIQAFTEKLQLGLNKTLQRLMVLAIEQMSKLRGLGAKKLRKQFDGILKIFGTFVEQHFESHENENSKKTKKFVEKTLAAFAPYTQVILNNLEEKSNENVSNENQQKNLVKKGKKRKHSESEKHTKEKPTVDLKFQRICKIYIGHSLDYRNPHAVHLMQLAVNAQQQLKLAKDEIEFVLNTYWRQLNEDLKENNTELSENLEAVIKLIIGNMMNEDLLITLRDMLQYVAEPEKYGNILMKLLALIAKCNFSKIKGAIFNEQFKQISSKLLINWPKDGNGRICHLDKLQYLLQAQLALADNKTIPLTPDSMDTVLTTLIDIDIKNYKLTDTNSLEFFALHTDMVELCKSLVKFRHVLLLSRVPQLMHIFKDLIQSLICFKSEREKDAVLSEMDLENLTESAHKVEVLMNLIVQHGADVKRLVPFVLTYIINLIVTNERSTTLYPQVKSHIENVCLALISICDHKAGSFILRVSNEAARQTYETLLKEHHKFHTFKGKV